MTNVQMYLKLANDSVQDLGGDTGREFIEGIVGDDTCAPPQWLVIQATCADGQQVTVSIPYSDHDSATIEIT